MSNQIFINKLNAIIETAQNNPFVNIPKEEIAEIMASHTQEAYVSIRMNPLKQKKEDYQHLEQVSWCDTAYYLPERPIFTLDPKFHGGAYYVQEASSIFLQHVIKHIQSLQDTSPKRYLDLCAAPGGKSTLLASTINAQDLIISNEVIQTRAQILVENAIKWGHINHWVVNNDPKDYAPLANFFDTIVVDAPCTGSGLWRKDEASIDEWSAAHVQLCSDRQKRIVGDILPSLKPNGYLVYATCSYSPEEDEQLCDFLIDNFDLESVIIPTDPQWNIHETKSDKHAATGYHFYPWRLKGEGFYLAVFKKKDAPIIEEKAKKNKQKNKDSMPNSKVKIDPLPWLKYIDDAYELKSINDAIYAFEKEQVADFELIKQHLYVKKAGIRLGTVMGKDVIPEHELALSTIIKADIPTVKVDKDTALQFLKKENIVIDDSSLKGWYVVQYEGVNIGWGKWMQNRMNNYLPKNWRIRMDIK